MEAVADEEMQSVRANPSATAPSAPTPEVLMTSAQQAEEDDIVLVTGPHT